MESHQKLKDKARNIEPIIRIGKNGLSEGQINEIKKLIKKRKLIKVKMLDSFMDGKDRAEVAQEMAQKSETTLIQIIGNIVVLYQE